MILASIRKWKYLLLTNISLLCIGSPSFAAEKINIIYGSLNLDLQVESLEKFADEGVVNQELEFYFKNAGLKPEQQEALRQTLSKQFTIDGVQLSAFLNTPTGEILLERMGNLISGQGGRNGKYLLRGALVQAALDKEEGLTLINFLKYLATDVELNVGDIQQMLDYQKRLSLATDSLTKDALNLVDQSITNSDRDYSKIPDLREQGKYGVRPPQILQLHDRTRDRKFDVHIYQPQTWRSGGKTPVVVVSHGLGSQPEDFKALGEQLASYGFFVAIPQHIGSDNKQIEAMMDGYSDELYDLQDFINRPLDISYVLDELETRNQSEFDDRLDLEKVGVLGHSFGGYTALAVAGATWDFDNIRTYCDRRVWEANISMLLQCQTLDLPEREYSFRDARVKAIGVMNPVNSVVFGSQGLSKVEIPVIIGAGTNDPATPPIIEQIRTFAWVTSEDKYLFVMEGQAHFLSNPDPNSQINNLVNLLVNFQGIDKNLFTVYGNTQATAFLQNYLMEDENYQIYLEPAYWQYISEESFPIYWLDREAVNTLTETYNSFKPAEIPTLYAN